MSQQLPGVGIVETQYFDCESELQLTSGLVLPGFRLAFETYGHLNAQRDNAILLLHALSGDAHAAGYHSPSDRKPGWWDEMVGPGRAFDTNKYFFICSNVLGGCKGSTGPNSINPLTGKRWASDFPVLTIKDMVAAQVHLIDYLGIQRLFGVAGGSMGGFQAIEWMIAHADRVNSAILLATTASSSAHAIAWNAIGRQAIVRDPKWRGGHYPLDDAPVDGLSVARMIGHITYLSDASLSRKFPERFQGGDAPVYTLADEFALESYLNYQAQRFNERFDANSYLYITKAMDYWDGTRGYADLNEALAHWRKPTLIVSFDSDWLYPTRDAKTIAQAVGEDATFIELSSPAGHDAFLIESAMQTPIIQRFLRQTEMVIA
jgi:homoserine O-acetyltransferase